MTRPAQLLPLAAALFLALPVLAESPAQTPAPAAPAEATPMSAEAFDSYTLGRTLSYVFQGTPYGIEQYLPNRRVRWTFIGRECQDGSWYEEAGNICFVYDNAPDDAQCWRFFTEGDGLRAVFQGPDGPSTELYEAQQSEAPLVCMGPGVGV